MKAVVNLLILVAILTFFSCKKKEDIVIEYLFEASVIGKGQDCGDIYILKLKNTAQDSNIEDGTYYANNLDAQFKVEGLKIDLNCREPKANELISCTTQGPGYSQIMIINSKKQ